MAKISDIPNEILRPVLLYCALRWHGEQPWYDLNYQARHPKPTTLFPFNVARVCRHWLDILKDSPSIWKDVFLDIKDDPTPFLDVFLWSQDYPLRVAVYNTETPTSDDPEIKALERKRVKLIIDALNPHVAANSRCVSIVFRLLYSSSLPSAIPFFEDNSPSLLNLILEARINDTTAETYPSEPTLQVRTTTHFGDLGYLTLTGRGFTLLDRLSQGWIARLSVAQFFSLHLSDLLLTSKCSGFEAAPTSFVAFVHGMCSLPRLRFLTLKNVVLDHVPRALTAEMQVNPQRNCILNVASLTFEDVSRDFLQLLFANVDIVSWGQEIDIGTRRTEFIRCSIPKVKGILMETEELILDEVPESPAGSIQNAFAIWSGRCVLVRRCPTFNKEAAASWLVQRRARRSLNLYGQQLNIPRILKED